MEMFDLLVVCDWTPGTGHWREGWSTAVERRGEQSVTTILTTLMPGLSVECLDFQSVSFFFYLLRLYTDVINPFQMVPLATMEVPIPTDKLPLVCQCI